MTRAEIINGIKTRIDEITPINGLIVPLTGFDDKPIDTFIDFILDECGDDTQMAAPLWKLNAEESTATANAINEYSGYVDVPDNFLRLIGFRMMCWKRTVTELAIEGSVTANRQHNRFLRGGTAKPVCVIGHGSDAQNRPKRTIEYYSVVRNNHTIERFLYAAQTAAENLPDMLIEALMWKCASKVLQITGNANYQIAEERFKVSI